MGKKLNHYVLESLPVDNIDICGIYYIKEEGETAFKMYIRNYENDFWIDNGSGSPDLSGYATESWVASQGYLTTESDPTVPSHVKAITTTNISNWNAKQAALSGTGFVKSAAGVISYDNRTFLPKSFSVGVDVNCNTAIDGIIGGNFFSNSPNGVGSSNVWAILTTSSAQNATGSNYLTTQKFEIVLSGQTWIRVSYLSGWTAWKAQNWLNRAVQTINVVYDCDTATEGIITANSWSTAPTGFNAVAGGWGILTTVFLTGSAYISQTFEAPINGSTWTRSKYTSGWSTWVMVITSSTISTSSLTALSNGNVATALKTTNRTYDINFTAANQSIDIEIGNGSNGFVVDSIITVRAIASYNINNVSGVIEKTGKIKSSSPSTMWQNDFHYTEATGIMGSNYVISNPRFDATKNKIVVTVTQKGYTAGPVYITLNIESTNTTINTSISNNLSISSLYTDATVYDTAFVSVKRKLIAEDGLQVNNLPIGATASTNILYDNGTGIITKRNLSDFKTDLGTTVPTASASVLGVVKVGSGLAIDGTGILSATGGGTGTVTSVALSTPTGLTVTGSPITTTGTLAISLTSGYSIPTTTKQSNWDSAFGWGNHAGLYSLLAHTHTFDSLTYKPSTLSGFGIVDAYPLTGNPSGFLTSFTESDPTVPSYAKSLTAFSVIKTDTDALYETIFSKNSAFNKNFGTTAGTVSEGNHTHTFSSLSSKPTTLSGYGITDSYTKTESDNRYSQTDTTYSVFTTGVDGLVPARVGATTTKYLREDGTWQPITTGSSSWGSITGTLADQTDLQNALDDKSNLSHTHTFTSITSKPTTLSGYGITDAESAFTKNTGFNKNFGTTAGTVAQGNDSRILNGQTAFGWGDHASAGYLTSFTETDPTVPTYAKSLTAFSVIKGSTDALYYPLTGNPSGFLTSGSLPSSILNQTSTVQTANFKISGTGIMNGIEFGYVASTYKGLLSTVPFSFFTTGGLANSIYTKSILASDSYSDSSLIPATGIYSKGSIRNATLAGTGTRVISASSDGTLTIGTQPLFTESDPTVPSYSKSLTAFSVIKSSTDPLYYPLTGNPSSFLTSFTESDPTVPSHVKAITTTNISNWNTAYSWGNHATAGYLTSEISEWEENTYEYAVPYPHNGIGSKGIDTNGGYSSKTQIISTNSSVNDDVEHVIRWDNGTGDIDLNIPLAVNFKNRLITISNRNSDSSIRYINLTGESVYHSLGLTIDKLTSAKFADSGSGGAFPDRFSSITIKSMNTDGLHWVWVIVNSNGNQ